MGAGRDKDYGVRITSFIKRTRLLALWVGQLAKPYPGLQGKELLDAIRRHSGEEAYHRALTLVRDMLAAEPGVDAD